MSFNPKTIDYDKLKAVYYVGLTGNMTHAGQMMGVCQSAVTKQIQDLESRFNALLFDRTDRLLILTQVGHKVFDFAKFLVESSNALVKGITHARLDMEGHLNILTTPSLANTWLPYYLRGFHDIYPNITLNILGSLEFLAPVDTDVIITSHRSHNPDFIQQELFVQKVGLFATKTYLEKYGIPQTLEDLDGHKLIAVDRTMERNFPFVNWILKVGKVDVREARKASMHMSGNDGAAQAMIHHHGIASLSFDHVKILNRKDIVHVLPEIISEEAKYYFIYHKKVEDFRKYNALYEHIRKNYRT